MLCIKEELLIQLITQANENLRATDSKKNQLYYFYIVMSGFYFTAYKDISDSYISVVFNLFVSVVGLTFIYLIIKYQEWHEIYVNDSKMIQKIIHGYDGIKFKKEVLGDIYFGIKGNTTKKKRGAEYYLYLSFIIINFLNLSILVFQIFKTYIKLDSYYKCQCYIDSILQTFSQHPYPFTLACLIGFFTVLWLYIYLLTKFRDRMIQKTIDGYLDRSWIISGFK